MYIKMSQRSNVLWTILYIKLWFPYLIK